MSIKTDSIGIFECQFTSAESVKNLSLITESYLQRKITVVQPHEMVKWLEEKKGLLILPGGVCSGWDSVLPIDFQKKLANWVKQGNKIFGVCAGAYYCTKKTIYSFPQKELIQKSRQVELFKGKCIGPLYPMLKVIKVRWYTGTIGHVVLLWGGVFEPETKGDHQTLATFDSKQSKGPAVVLSQTGAGLSILSSLHWEWNGEDLSQCELLDIQKKKAKLDASRGFRQNCLNEMKQLFFS